jgi:HlyD family secretion protein
MSPVTISPVKSAAAGHADEVGGVLVAKHASQTTAPARHANPNDAGSSRGGWGRKGVIGLIVALVVAAGAYAVLQFFRPTVTVSEAVEGPVVQAFYSTGTIEPEREYPIHSNIAGTIEAIKVDKGDAVKTGDVLAVVTDPALQFAFDKARAELDEKRTLADAASSPVLSEYDSKLQAMNSLLEIALREQKRMTDLLERGAGSQTDLDRAIDRVKTTWSEAESIKAQKAARLLSLKREVDVAEAALNTAKWNLDQQTLRSPIDGVVLNRPASLRTRLAINDPVLRVADVRPGNLVMRAAVDEEDVTKVRVGQAVRMSLYAFPGETLAGKVTRVYDQADSERRTFEVDVKLDRAGDRLSPGMTGELAFILAEKEKAVVVPSQSLQGGAVYAVRGGTIARADVEIGIRSVERVEILSGLSKGDTVLISPVGSMQPGQHVRTTYVDPAAAAGIAARPQAGAEGFKGMR